MKQQAAKLIDPKEMGHRPLELKQPIFDEDAVERADSALKALSSSFGQWLDEELAKLQSARVEAAANGWSDASLEKILIAAHDLKGLGATYDYPIVTQIAASLCRLIETDQGRAAARAMPALLEGHVDAARAVVRAGAKTDSHPIGRALLLSLEGHVKALNVAAS